MKSKPRVRGGIILLAVLLAGLLTACGGGGGNGGDTNNPPIANAGLDQTVTTGSLVILDGSGSSDPDGDLLTYSWSFASFPSGSNAALSDPAVVNPTFTADVDGSYVVSLVVNDGTVDSAADTVTITAIPAAAVSSVINLPETGQTTCYDAGGSVIDCATQGQTQDGAVLAGVSWPSPRFKDNRDGTITDNLTGLVWLKRANCFGRRDWATALSDANGLADGACGLTDGSSPGDWRLPNVNELESLINAEVANPAAWLGDPAQGFDNVLLSSYWTATTFAELTEDAWVVSMSNGEVVGANPKVITIYVWPVRAGQTDGSPDPAYPANIWKTGQTTCYDAAGSEITCAGTGQDGEIQAGVSWPAPRFKDNGDATVTDKLTGLMWTKDANAPGPPACTTATAMTWQDALDYVDCLNTNSYLGYNDWRLPNRKELHSLTDFSRFYPALPADYSAYFTNVQRSTYWSATTVSGSYSAYAWAVSIRRGNVSRNTKTSGNRVWPVRAGSDLGHSGPWLF